jgi:hypothetical protein
MKIEIASICQAFQPRCVGTRVLHRLTLMDALEEKIQESQIVGSSMLDLSDCALTSCLSGSILKSEVPKDGYVVREWRDELIVCARRQHCSYPKFLRVLVYDGAAYRTDPQIGLDEAERVAGAEYVIVAVLGTDTMESPLSSHRFVRNIAIGKYDPVHLIEQARKIAEYEKRWITVAD